MLNILLPLDGSELAESAIPHAHTMAASIAAKVTLLRVVSPEEFRNEDAFSRVDWRLRKEQARSYLRDVAKTFDAANIPYELRVEEGHPAEVILETARDLDIHLLVMSTHGRGAAIDFAQGGVVSKVLSAFGASVCLVGSRSVPATKPSALYQRLLVPIDGSHESECALRTATLLARSMEAQLTVVCVSEIPEVPLILGGDERARDLCRELADMTRTASQRKLVDLVARLPEQLSLRTAVMLTDRFTNQIAEVARRFNPDLLVTSMTMTDYVNSPYASATRFASAVDHVPMLLLGPKGMGDVFCDPGNVEPADVLTADAS